MIKILISKVYKCTISLLVMETEKVKLGDITVEELLKIDVNKKYIIRVGPCSLADLAKLRVLLVNLGLKKDNFILIETTDMDIVEVKRTKCISRASANLPIPNIGKRDLCSLKGCQYSRAMGQTYPRKCIHCQKLEVTFDGRNQTTYY